MERIIRNIVDTCADRRLGDMLDYVYFQTEPMENAERRKPLDFSKIEVKSEVRSHRHPEKISSSKAKAIEATRRLIEAKKNSLSPGGKCQIHTTDVR